MQMMRNRYLEINTDYALHSKVFYQHEFFNFSTQQASTQEKYKHLTLV